VTLFVHPPSLETAPLRVFNLVRTNGLAPTTAALAVVMQSISFIAVLAFFPDLRDAAPQGHLHPVRAAG